MSFDKQCGRLRVTVSSEGLRMPNYGHGATVECVAGWNDNCPVVKHTVSVDELRDLHYLIGRAIEAAQSERLSV
jgi:hypothetical protein